MDLDAPYRSIAAAIDGGPADDRIAEVARRLAALGTGASLSLVHVASVPPPMGADPIYSGWLGVGATVDPSPFMDAGQILLDRVARTGEERVLLGGYPAESVCEFAEDEGIDLLVVGAHRGRGRLALGSFASYVGHHAPCPVLIVRPASARHEPARS